MISLETERLIIRNFTPDDGEALLEMIEQYEASGLAVYDQQWPTSPEAIRGVAEWFASRDRFLAVCLKDTGWFIGFVSLNQEEKEGIRAFNLGYIFNFDYHGKGYATEACRAALEHAFSPLEADRAVTGTAAVNHASYRLLERLGFIKTAEGMGSFRNGPDGKPIEFVGYSYELTRKDWMITRKKVNI